VALATHDNLRNNEKAKNEELPVRVDHSSHSLCSSEHGNRILPTDKFAIGTIPTSVARDGDVQPSFSSILSSDNAEGNERK
jgi:hypothetical protein